MEDRIAVLAHAKFVSLAPCVLVPQPRGGDGALNTSVGSTDRASAGSSTAQAIKTHMAAFLLFKNGEGKKSFKTHV